MTRIRILVGLIVLTISTALIAGLFVFNNEKNLRFNKIQQHKVIEVKAQDIDALYGKAFGNISVYAVKDEALQAIPFQFEEFEHLATSYENTARKEKKSKGVFDGYDLLVFMLKDSGIKATSAQLENLELVSTLKLEDGGNTSFVYLIKNGQASKERYVQFDESTGIITMPDATIQMNPKDILDWGDFIPLTDGIPEEKSLLDCLKIRINGRFLAFQLHLNNNNLKAKLSHVYHGPVRVVMNGKIQAVISNIPLLSADAQMIIDSSSALLFIDMKVPSQYSKLMKDPVVLIGVDGNNLYGQAVQTSVSGNSIYNVDGKMDEDEKSLNKVNVKESSSWLWLSDDKDLNLIGQYDLSANENFDPEKYPDISIFYLDDEKLIDKPERFKGSVPTLGYRLEGLPKSENIRMSYKVLVIQDMKPLSAGEFLDGMEQASKITALKP